VGFRGLYFREFRGFLSDGHGYHRGISDRWDIGSGLVFVVGGLFIIDIFALLFLHVNVELVYDLFRTRVPPGLRPLSMS
jgi:hypothetical protein